MDGECEWRYFDPKRDIPPEKRILEHKIKEATDFKKRTKNIVDKLEEVARGLVPAHRVLWWVLFDNARSVYDWICKQEKELSKGEEPMIEQPTISPMPEITQTADTVNHPKHYADSCSLECIDVMEMVFGKYVTGQYCLMNAFKYLWRHKHKNGEEDLKKAEWYIKHFDALCANDPISASTNRIRCKIAELAHEALEDAKDSD